MCYNLDEREEELVGLGIKRVGCRKAELRQTVVTKIFIIIPRSTTGGVGGHTHSVVKLDANYTCIL